MQVGDRQRLYQPAGCSMIGIALSGKTGNNVKADLDISNLGNNSSNKVRYELRGVFPTHCGKN